MRFPTELIEVDPDVYLYSSVVFASNEQLWLVMFFQHSSSYHHRCSVMLWFSIQFFLPYSLWFSNSEVSTGIRDSHDSAQVCLRLSYSEWCHRIWCVLLTDRKRSRQYLHGIMRSTGWSLAALFWNTSILSTPMCNHHFYKLHSAALNATSRRWLKTSCRVGIMTARGR